MRLGLAVGALVGLGQECLGASSPAWQTAFVRPAFLVQKPTALYQPDSWTLVQTVKPGNPPLALADTAWIQDRAGARYGRTRTGELIMVQSPRGNNSERKGQVVFLPRGGRERLGRLKEPSGLAAAPGGPPPARELAAGAPVLALYALPDKPGRPWVFVESDEGEGWVPWNLLVWSLGKDGPGVATQAAGERPGPARTAVEAIKAVLAQYNHQVQRAVEYYRSLGRPVEARTFELVSAKGRADRIDITLARSAGLVALPEAEAMLERLLVQELGREVKILWP